MEKSGKCRECS